MIPFDDYANYYDLLYWDKDYLGECEYLKSLVEHYAQGTRRIIEFGSGSGIHGRILADMGFIVHGIERSQSMIDLGKHHHNIPKTLNAQSGGQFHCSLGDCTTDIVGNDFDLTLALFHVLSYQIKDNQVTDMLSNANRQLKNEGVFILDYWYAPALLEMGTEIRIKRASNEKLSVTRIAEPKSDSVKNRVDVNYLTFVEDLSSGIIRKIEECHKMRAFEPHEINDIADSCGFQVVKNEEWMTRAEPSNKTWGVCTILQKKSNC